MNWYVNMCGKYIYMRCLYVNMQHNYVEMQLIFMLQDNTIMMHINKNKSDINIYTLHDNMLHVSTLIPCMLT